MLYSGIICFRLFFQLSAFCLKDTDNYKMFEHCIQECGPLTRYTFDVVDLKNVFLSKIFWKQAINLSIEVIQYLVHVHLLVRKIHLK